MKKYLNKLASFTFAVITPVMLYSCFESKDISKEIENESEKLRKEAMFDRDSREKAERELKENLGGKLIWGDTAPNCFYVVKEKDTLSNIAYENKISYEEIAKINKIKNPYKIYPGQRIKLNEKCE